MRPWIKICGITALHDARAVVEAGGDAVGFIFYKKSARYISPEDAGRIVKQLPDSVAPFGVFVNEAREEIERTIGISGIRGIQLSGDESPADCTGYTLDVIKAFRIRDPDRSGDVRSFSIKAALLDGADGTTYGGSGRLAHPDVALQIKQYHRLILSGGIDPENVSGLIARIQPYGIDVNSGLESSPGHKDHARIRTLFNTIDHIEALTQLE